MTKNPASNKQVVYVDVEDEITAVIDKMNASPAKVVALVLPKRATVFQSVVNMKLLKRRAESAKKHVVLITSEAGLMPLAGLAGVHVASTLQSKPEIPQVAGDGADLGEGDDTAAIGDDFDHEGNADQPIGDLANRKRDTLATASSGMAAKNPGAPAGTKPAGGVAGMRHAPGVGALPGGIGGKTADESQDLEKPASTTPKNRKLNVPDFLRFRKRLIFAGVALVLLAVGWYFAYFVMPKATVTIKTNTKDVDVDLAMVLDTGATSADTDKLVIPAQTKQEQKSSTQQAPATGQANKGEKATGSVTLTNCTPSSDPVTIPAGTGISNGDKTFITQKSVTLENSTPNCKSVDGFTSATVNVTAQNSGAAYNIGASSFTVAGVANVKAASSSPMSGGTDNNVKIVQQSDIDSAQQKLGASQDQETVKKQLQSRLEDEGLYAIVSTFAAGTPAINTSSKAGDEAESVTVSQSVTYTMFGIRKSDLQKIVEAQVKKKVDDKTQTVQDYGLDDARFAVETPGAGPQQKVDVALNAVAGPKLRIDEIAKNIEGLKSGQVKEKLKAYEGVEDVTVKYSPFWVTKAPKAEKTTVQFEKSSGSNAGANDGGNGQ